MYVKVPMHSLGNVVNNQSINIFYMLGAYVRVAMCHGSHF